MSARAQGLLFRVTCGWLALVVGAVGIARAQALQPIPKLDARVTDLTGTLTAAQQSELEQKLAAFEAGKGAQIVVLIVPTTHPEEIEQYSIRVVEQWRIGRAHVDDGVLLIVAKNDRRVRIEVGYGLEGALPDATANRIITETIRPLFAQNDFYGGISAGVDQITRVVSGEALPEPEHARRGGASRRVSGLFPFLMLAVFATASILPGMLGRPLGAAVAAASAAAAPRAVGSVMRIGRVMRHLFATHWSTRRRFTPAVLAAIEASVSQVESQHAGEIRFVVETALHPADLWQDLAPRQRALQVFGQLRVWDTAHNNGVLIYVLLADRDVEILADRGLAARVPQVEWDEICREMERHFKRGEFGRACVHGVEHIGGLLARHFPRVGGTGANELPNEPVLL